MDALITAPDPQSKRVPVDQAFNIDKQRADVNSVMVKDKRKMNEAKIVGVTRDQVQRRRLHLIRGDVLLPDGRKLREIMGYARNIRQELGDRIDDATFDGFIEMRGFLHVPTNFLVTGSINKTQWGPLMHVSMSYPDRDPTWEEIKGIRSVFFPDDVDVMQMLPRSENFVNMHLHCFHLWQTPQEWNVG